MKVDLRNTDTKERIIAEAIRQFQVGGYSHLNLDAIAKSLNITRPALYFHFSGGKEQLYIEVIKSFGADITNLIQAAICGGNTTYARLRNLLLMVARHPLLDQKQLIMAHHDSLTSDAQAELKNIFYNISQLINSIIENGIRDGELRKVDVNIACFSLMGLGHQVEQYINLQEILPEDFTCKIPLNVEELVEQLLDLWFTGMQAPAKDCRE